MEQGNSTPDLQTILATLAQFAAPVPSEPPSLSAAPGRTTPQIDSGALRAATLPASVEKATDPRLRPQNRSATASPRPVIDPASITVWPEALRCVTKIAAQNAHFAMMRDQRDHEMRWYSERQNLKQTHANRSLSAAKAQSILKSLNSNFGNTSSPAPDPEAKKEAELAEFDQKIYAAQQAMEVAMTAELKGLGVPFFGTDQSLVVPDEYDVSQEQLPESHPKCGPLITESKLLELKRKMIGHLEDLYRD